MTGFARFLIFLILIVPIALVVSHMANNNWQFDQNKFLQDLNLKNNTEQVDSNEQADEISEVSEVEEVETTPTEPTTTEEQTDIERPNYVAGDTLEVMQKYIEDLESKLDEAKVEIEDLKNKLYRRDYLMNQIDSLQKVIKNSN